MKRILKHLLKRNQMTRVLLEDFGLVMEAMMIWKKKSKSSSLSLKCMYNILTVGLKLSQYGVLVSQNNPPFHPLFVWRHLRMVPKSFSQKLMNPFSCEKFNFYFCLEKWKKIRYVTTLKIYAACCRKQQSAKERKS